LTAVHCLTLNQLALWEDTADTVRHGWVSGERGLGARNNDNSCVKTGGRKEKRKFATGKEDWEEGGEGDGTNGNSWITDGIEEKLALKTSTTDVSLTPENHKETTDIHL